MKNKIEEERKLAKVTERKRELAKVLNSLERGAAVEIVTPPIFWGSYRNCRGDRHIISVDGGVEIGDMITPPRLIAYFDSVNWKMPSSARFYRSHSYGGDYEDGFFLDISSIIRIVPYVPITSESVKS